MTTITCPSCRQSDADRRGLEAATFEWTCSRCRNHYEVRVVFLRRPPPIDAGAFRTRLRRKMVAEGLSQREVAELAGVSAPYVSTVLRGKRRASPAFASRVNEALRLGLGDGGEAVG